MKLGKIGKALVAASAIATGSFAVDPTLTVPFAEPPTAAIELGQWQKAYLADHSRFKLAHWARGTRKTFTTTLEAVNDILEVEAAGGRTRWIIASRGERQSLVAIAFAKQHAQALAMGINAVTEERDLVDDLGNLITDAGGFVVKYKVHTITFPNGSEIVAVPANPDTLRGYTGNLLLDEFAFHADSRKIWMAVFPIIRGIYKLRIASTGNGKANKFYELATSTDLGWSIHRVDIYTAVAQGLDLDIEETRKALNDDDAWAQEYELDWLDEASSWISFDMINEVERDDAGKPDLYKGGACYSGEDIGIRSDLWVMWVAEMIGDVLVTREISVLPRAATFQAQDEERRRLFKKYLIVRHCMDQTGMGEKPVEDAKREHGQLRVEGVIFNNSSKLLLATIGKERFQDKTLRVPMGDKALRADLHKLKKEATPNGAPRFVAPSDSDGHADRAWACFLMCYAASGTPMVYDYIRVRMSASSYDDDDDPTEGGRWTTYRNGQEAFE